MNISKKVTTPNYLILVNKRHPIPLKYYNGVQMVTAVSPFGDTRLIEEQTYKAYEELRAFLYANGIEIGLISAYRSIRRQFALFRQGIRRNGIQSTYTAIAFPGCSEHHTGLAIDIGIRRDGIWISNNDELLHCEEEMKFIHSALPNFGFILRYPIGKEIITGFSYEPWHFRYVGRETAESMVGQLTLEEYLF